jgi:hypothetical protein
MVIEGNLVERSLSDGRIVQNRHEIMRFHLRQMAEDWALYEVSFEVKEDNSAMDIFLLKKGVLDTFYLDEVLIKDANTALFRKDGRWISKDNYWYID